MQHILSYFTHLQHIRPPCHSVLSMFWLFFAYLCFLPDLRLPVCCHILYLMWVKQLHRTFHHALLKIRISVNVRRGEEHEVHAVESSDWLHWIVFCEAAKWGCFTVVSSWGETSSSQSIMLWCFHLMGWLEALSSTTNTSIFHPFLSLGLWALKSKNGSAKKRKEISLQLSQWLSKSCVRQHL